MLNRRDTLKISGAAALGLLAAGEGAASEKKQTGEISVTGYAYDRVQAIEDGKVGVEGVKVTFHDSNIYQLNSQAFGPQKPFEVTELGLIPYVTQYMNNGFRGYVLIPVFISRTFRHRNIYAHVDSGIEKPEDLRGRKVGTPGYGASANTWVRGMLQDQYGVAASDMQWIETTITPRVIAERNPQVRPLFTNLREAKQVAYSNLATTTVLRTTLPWVTEEYEETRQLMGDDYWRYGIEANRRELESVMRFTHEQGLVKERGNFVDLFHPETVQLLG